MVRSHRVYRLWWEVGYFLCMRWSHGRVLGRGMTGSDLGFHRVPLDVIWRMDRREARKEPGRTMRGLQQWST